MHTTREVPDRSLILGRTQDERGSEIQAGARAELTPSPLTLALSSLRGRVTARIMLQFANNPAALNFTAARTAILEAGVARALHRSEDQPVIVDMACGYSPLALHMAEHFPHASVIELDTPDVIIRRKRRLMRCKEYVRPANLVTLSADLSRQSLVDALGNRVPSVIEYTSSYLTREQMIETHRYLYDVLSIHGALVTFMTWQKGVQQVQAELRFFREQVGSLPGIVADEAAAAAVFLEAGFRHVEVLHPSRLAGELGLATPIMDIELLVIAWKQRPQSKFLPPDDADHALSR